MTPRNYFVAAGLIAAGVLLAGCTPPDAATAANAASAVPVMILSMGFSTAGRLAAAAPQVKRRYAALEPSLIR